MRAIAKWHYCPSKRFGLFLFCTVRLVLKKNHVSSGNLRTEPPLLEWCSLAAILLQPVQRPSNEQTRGLRGRDQAVVVALPQIARDADRHRSCTDSACDVLL